MLVLHMFFFFFFNDTATTEIYTLSLHDALPICIAPDYILVEEKVQVKFIEALKNEIQKMFGQDGTVSEASPNYARSEEHTSELQSQSNLVCRLLLEKKKTKTKI